MSNYSGFEITIEKINLTDDAINKLKNITGCFLHTYENITKRIEKNYLRYHKAFNYDDKKVFSTLGIIEPYIIENDEVIEIGTVYNENETNVRDGNVYTYKGKIYVVFFDYYCYGWIPDDYTYKIISTDGDEHSQIYDEERDLKELFENFNALKELKVVISETCKNSTFQFESEDDKKEKQDNAQKIILDKLDNLGDDRIFIIDITKRI